MKTNSILSEILDDEVTKIIKQFPAITISKGMVSIDQPEPYYIYDEETDTPLMIIDTTGHITSLNDTEARVLLTKTEIMIKRDKTDIQGFDLSQIDSYYVDRSILYKSLELFKEWFVIFLYPFAVIFSFFYRIIQVLIYAAIFFIFTRGINSSLTYMVLIRLAVISITPVIVVEALLILLNTVIPYWWFISVLVSVGYLFFAVKVNSEEDQAITV